MTKNDKTLDIFEYDCSENNEKSWTNQKIRTMTKHLTFLNMIATKIMKNYKKWSNMTKNNEKYIIVCPRQGYFILLFMEIMSWGPSGSVKHKHIYNSVKFLSFPILLVSLNYVHQPNPGKIGLGRPWEGLGNPNPGKRKLGEALGTPWRGLGKALGEGFGT